MDTTTFSDDRDRGLPRLPEPRIVPSPWPQREDDDVDSVQGLGPVEDEQPSTWGVVSETRRVVLRIQGAEEIELGRAEGRDPAVRLAREMIGAIEEAQARGEWPLVEDRFIRPGAIVSVDVQRAA